MNNQLAMDSESRAFVIGVFVGAAAVSVLPALADNIRYIYRKHIAGVRVVRVWGPIIARTASGENEELYYDAASAN